VLLRRATDYEVGGCSNPGRSVRREWGHLAMKKI